MPRSEHEREHIETGAFHYEAHQVGDLDVSRYRSGSHGHVFGTPERAATTTSPSAPSTVPSSGRHPPRHAEVYGPYTTRTRRPSDQDRRDEVVLATIRDDLAHRRWPGNLDSSPANIRIAVEGSLQRPRPPDTSE